MKFNWCAFAIHTWKYTADKTRRTCVHCGKEMELDSEPPLSAFDNPEHWYTVKKVRELKQK